MASFSYIAVNAAGKELKGTVEADSAEKASAGLKKQGLTVASVAETGALGKDVNLAFLEKKPTPRDLAVFCRQFTSIVNAGVSVVSALDMLSEQTENKRLRAAITECRRDIEKGETLAAAMGKHREIFSDMFITLAEAGEASGSLDVSFTRMAEQFEKSSKLHATVKKASIYPIVVLVVAFGVIMGMLLFIVPSFQSMFDSIGGTLPGITLFMIAASAFVQKWWWLLIAGIVALVLGIKYFGTTDAGKHLFGKLGLKLPGLGNLNTKTASARMGRTLSTLMAAGIPMIEAIEITASTMSNVYFKEALEDAKDDVAMGLPLSEAVKKTGLFPPMVHHMLSIGEETGDIDAMMTKLADYYEEEVEAATAQVMALLEPLIIILLAGIVFFIILSVLMPMMSMYSALDSM